MSRGVVAAAGVCCVSEHRVWLSGRQQQRDLWRVLSDREQGVNFLALFLLLGAYGVSIPGITYIISFLFEKNATAQTMVMAGYTLLNMVTFFTSFLLEFPSLGLPVIAGDLCRYIFMLFPNYALAKVAWCSRRTLCLRVARDCDMAQSR